MSRFLRDRLLSLHQTLRALLADDGGQITIMFAAASLGIFMAVGAGVDLASAYAARQRLSEVAQLTCQYSTRPSVGQTAASNSAGTNGFQNYKTAVNNFAKASLTSQKWSANTPTASDGTTTNYFTATQGTAGATGSAAAANPTNPAVEMSAAVPTYFGGILGVSTVTVHTKINCQALANSTNFVPSPTLLQEGFEAPCASYCFRNPSGGTTALSSPAQTFPATAGYTGLNGYQWYIVGYCLETDAVGVINANVPEQTHSAELDCDNGSGSRGNSSMSTKLFLTPGQYELRYFYKGRVDYPTYDPVYVCGTTASDVAWANDTSGYSPGLGANVARTNQVNVYLDANIPGGGSTPDSAPLHTTMDGTQSLAGSNLIDMCVYSQTWTERSVRIKVTATGYYWLTFAADGASDSYGGQVDYIRLCIGVCAGALQDNFPTAWLPSGGVNKVLFEDAFGSPTYPANSAYTAGSPYTYSNANLNGSTGTTGTSSAGWPSATATGWATAPYNQATYVLNGAYTGTTQYVELDGRNPTGNRLISRPFVLVPGYYNISYNYISLVNFGGSATYCFNAPASGVLFPAQGASSGTFRYGSSVSVNNSTNVIGLYMSHSALVSTPVGGGAQGSQTSYTNPDGTVSTTPTVPPDGINPASYVSSVPNPLLDMCAYVSNYSWSTRSVNVKITKPGLYWMTFSANGGSGDGYGGAIDDPKLTALGSPYMASPPTTALVTIPVPTPAPDSIYAPGTYPGFTIRADPFTPPAADQ